MVKNNEEISAKELFKKAKKLIYSNLFVQGIDILKKEVKRNPKNIEAWNLMGMAYVFMKKIKKAIECWQSALEIDPTDLKLWFLIGAAYSGLGKYKKAISWYEDVLNFEPNTKWANFQIANNYFRQYKPGKQGIALSREQKKLYKAIEYYEEELRLQPKFTNVWSKLGFTYFLLEYNKAISCFQNVVDIDPKSVYGWFNLAFSYFAFKKYDNAIISFKKMIEINPMKEMIKFSRETDLANPFESLFGFQSSTYTIDVWDLIRQCYKAIKDKNLFKEFMEEYGLHYVEKFKSEISDIISKSPIKPNSLLKLINKNYQGRWTKDKKHYYKIAIEELIKDRAIEKKKNMYCKIQ